MPLAMGVMSFRRDLNAHIFAFFRTQLETHEQLNGLIGSKLQTPKAVSSYIDLTSNALPDGPLEVSPIVAKNQTPRNAQTGPCSGSSQKQRGFRGAPVPLHKKYRYFTFK
jgi:hypothetical protein